jgi:tol-pal system protein YbgF
MNKNLIILILPIAISYGCVATHEDLGSLYARQARLEAKTKQLSQQIEEVQFQPGSESLSVSDQKISELEARIANLERAYDRLRSMVRSSDRLSKLEPTYPTDSEKLFAEDDVAGFESSRLSEEDIIFNRGYKALSENKYEEAREQFSLFLKKFSESPQSSDAAFWIAESYFRQGQYEEAILDFQKFIEDYDKDIKVPLAYYKQGESLMNIDRKQEAIIFFQTLIDKFPQSEEARSAKEKLKVLE